MKILQTILPVMLLLMAASLQARTCDLTISANDAIEYDKSVLQAGPECDSVTLTLKHTGKLNVTQMGHNWVLADAADWKNVATDGLAAGQGNDYLTPDDDRVIAHTSLVGGGESTSVTFDLAGLDRNREYRFFCTFPGHYIVMNGSFDLTPDS